jgi:hypothetical protein
VSDLFSLCFRVSITFVYFGLTVISVSVGGNKYTSFILVALIELPAYVATYLSMNRFGRKFSLCSTLLISGIPCTAFAFLPPGTSAPQTHVTQVFHISGHVIPSINSLASVRE